MTKKLILFLITFLLFEINYVYAVEEEDLIRDWNSTSFVDAIDEKNTSLEENIIWPNLGFLLQRQFNEANASEKYYHDYGFVVKTKLENGEPKIDNNEIRDLQSIDSDGDYRIIGKNILGEWVENPFYNPIVNPDIDKRDWVLNNDFATINKSVIGPMVTTQNEFTNPDLIRKYYINFLYGFLIDYRDYLSDDYKEELRLAHYDYIQRAAAGEFDQAHWRDGLDSFWQVGSGGGTRTGTDMGDFIRIVSIPTKHSYGLAYLFHETSGGTVYYLSVLLRADSDIEAILFEGPTVTSSIKASTTIGESVNQVEGTFDFTIKSDRELASYEIFDISTGTTVNEPLTGSIPAGLTEYSASIPISISVPGNHQHVQISVRGTDIDGTEGTSTATADISKLSVPVGYSSSGIDPASSGILRSDERDSEAFDVDQGIPVTEDLYANVLTSEYIYEENYQEVNGVLTYTVTVSKTYDLKWEEWSVPRGEWVEQSDSETVSKTYTIDKAYLYHIIQQLDVYGLEAASVINETLDGGILNLSPRGYLPPTVDAEDHEVQLQSSVAPGSVSVDLGSETIDGGRSGKPSTPDPDWRSEATTATGSLEVRNDRVVFNGSTVMDDTWTVNSAPVPGSIPAAPLTDRDVLYESDLTIPSHILNGLHTSTGSVTYNRILSIHSAYGYRISQPIDTANDVTVHTPVVCYPVTENHIANVQLTAPNTAIQQLIIGESFDVYYPTSGQHLSIPGYGNRDYAAYTAARQVLFQFDVYQGENDQGTYYPKNTWIEITEDYTTFYLPNWVEESAAVNLGYRSLPINMPDLSADYENAYNDDLNEYKAVSQLTVESVGKVSDFQITMAEDPMWESHFTGSQSQIYSGLKNDVGQADTSHIYTLPMMPGKHRETGYDTRALKLGYGFKFSFETSGDMTGSDDAVVIRPSFYHVDENGQNRQPVDIYYESSGGFIQYGGAMDQMANSLQLNEAGRGMEASEISDTVDVLVSQNREGYDYSIYMNALGGGHAVNIRYGEDILLTEMQKTYIGSASVRPSGMTEEEVMESKQKWYGQFYLPTQSVAVPQGTDLSSYDSLRADSAPFMQEGYIVVNFDIEIYHSVTDMAALPGLTPYIVYETFSNGNQWLREGFETNQSGMTLSTGDVVFYHVDESAADDYR